MSLPEPFLFSSSQHSSLISQIVSIHSECIIHDLQAVTFLPDKNGNIDAGKMENYWHGLGREVAQGTRLVIVQCTDEKNDEVMGIVSLNMPVMECGPFRGYVEKLLVAVKHRQKGVGRRLMERLEVEAKERGKWLLILDTVVGPAAEKVYRRLEYIEWGLLPNFSINPRDGTLMDERWFYKDLRNDK
ncbi:acyl-CoA N-acyltransferase [Piedraia hortae CBS 480.64]|uniref:Acyl-CoA N-acyltransferase n=1 Tax=Piedraia hortae CBS 480.64 TaxID=1314780 RepID=A0A6A7BVE9_9PEZI|nr:acyl-CoA N-acyltransferase [Piedraia hortae CBS 480.64]